MSKNKLIFDPRQRREKGEFDLLFSKFLNEWLRKKSGNSVEFFLENELNFPKEKIDLILNNEISLDLFISLIFKFGESFIDEVIEPVTILRKNYYDFQFLKKILFEIIKTSNEIDLFKLYLNNNQMDNDILKIKNKIIHEIYKIFIIINNLSDAVDCVKKTNQDVQIFSGKVLIHEEMNLQNADGEHIELLKIYNECDGYLNDNFVNGLISSGVGHAASIYDENINIRRIGNGTVFWTEEQRSSVVGRSIWDIPGPRDYIRLVFDALTTAVSEKTPNLHVIGFKAGDNEALYERIAFPFPGSGLVIASPRFKIKF